MAFTTLTFALILIAAGSESSVWNWLVFSKTKESLGGRVRLILSGGAPLSASTQEFLKMYANFLTL